MRAVRAARVDACSPPLDRLERSLAGVALGDHAAYESVYDRVSGPVYGLVRRVLRDQAQSEEVAQEVLLHIWRAASQFDETHGSAMSWIMTIAHRRAVDRVRSEESRSRTLQRATDQNYSASYDAVADEVTIRLEQETVRACLEALTAKQRESVTLAYYDGLTYREVGERLGVPLGTIKTRIRDGLIQLRVCLGPESPDRSRQAGGRRFGSVI